MNSKEKSEINEDLRTKLADMVREDQLIRNKVFGKTGSIDESLIVEMEDIDNRNTGVMKGVIKEYGWPAISLVGEEGSRMAWLLVQHADKDIDFQEGCLELLKTSVERRDAPKKYLAYLTDRVLVNRGKSQRFGTQVEKRDGELVPKPVEDVDNLNKRRKEYSLETIEDYIGAIKKLHGQQQFVYLFWLYYWLIIKPWITIHF